MALKISYGSGALGDVTEVTSTVNSYARVTAVEPDSITIDTTAKIDGAATFSPGAMILIHVSATTSTSFKARLGRWLLATITATTQSLSDANATILSIDKDATQIIPSDELANYFVQAIAVAQYRNLTLSAGTTITPPNFLPTTYVGGILAIMCSETLTFDGGHISLTDCGIPPANKALRPATAKYDVAADTDTYSGVENSATKDFFLLNSGDGAAFLVAKKLICHEDSRIGNVTTYGCQFYRGASSSVTYGETAPSGITNVGGSTIFIAAETIENFGHIMLAKYRSSSATKGQGICRCYIASNTKLRNDEGLYAYDCISNPTRIKDMNIKNFGNGSFGDATNVTTQLNNYATITAIDGLKVTYKTKSTAGLAPIGAGALVMIHFNHKDTTNVKDAGRFILANVLADSGTVLTLDTAPPNISVEDYAAQIVSIPQFNNFTLAKENSATTAYNGAQGGICAIAVKNNCDLSTGKLSAKTATGGVAYSREGLAVIGNAQDCDKLPIGQGRGSVFILAKNLTLNSSTRLGAVSISGNTGGRYKGISDKTNLTLPSGAREGKYSTVHGGYGSSGSNGKGFAQGAHLMIIADKITGFALSAISTGGSPNGGAGMGGRADSSSDTLVVYGGYNGGAAWTISNYTGGSAGWAFVYCNNAVDQDTTNIIYDN